MLTTAIEDPTRYRNSLRVRGGLSELEYNGRVEELTRLECALLLTLLNAPEGGLTYAEVALALWGTVVSNASGRIYVHTANLRSKLLACTGASGLIRARHGRLRFDARLLGDCVIRAD
jgi:DNA-binding response OmpR family regulator